MGRLDGRVAIVTGAGRGIGRSVAVLLASEGAAVVVNDLGRGDGRLRAGRRARPSETVAAIVEAGGKAVANGADISDFDAAEDLIGAAIEEFGRLDVLVNVAGILRDRMVFNMTETGVGRRHPGAPEGHVQHHPVRVGALAVAARRDRAEPHHQLHLGLRPARGARPAELRGGQDGHRRADLLVGQLAGQVRGDRERDLARRGHPDDRLGADRAGAGPGPSAADERSPDNVAPIVAYLAVGAVRAGSPAGSSTRRATRSRCTATPSRSAGSSAPGRGTPTRSADQVERAFGPILGPEG